MRALSRKKLELRDYPRSKLEKLEAQKRVTPLAKASDLMEIFAEVKARRAEALALVKKEGLVLIQDKYSARGELYQVRIPHPALAIARGAEIQLAQLARLIGEEAEPEGLTASALLAATDKLLSERSN